VLTAEVRRALGTDERPLDSRRESSAPAAARGTAEVTRLLRVLDGGPSAQPVIVGTVNVGDPTGSVRVNVAR
jgi:hypothetical protein